MTTNSLPRRNIDHSSCGHPLTKADRAICRRARAAGTALLVAQPTDMVFELRGSASGHRSSDLPERDVHFTWLMGPKPEPTPVRPTYEPCTCTTRRGFHADEHEVWVCTTCDKPTALYLAELLKMTS